MAQPAKTNHARQAHTRQNARTPITPFLSKLHPAFYAPHVGTVPALARVRCAWLLLHTSLTAALLSEAIDSYIFARSLTFIAASPGRAPQRALRYKSLPVGLRQRASSQCARSQPSVSA